MFSMHPSISEYIVGVMLACYWEAPSWPRRSDICYTDLVLASTRARVEMPAGRSIAGDPQTNLGRACASLWQFRV